MSAGQKGSYDELAHQIRGEILYRWDPRFKVHARVFNGNVKALAKAVVFPVDAQDISTIIRYCTQNSISPSIKAGGYGTGGWALSGDIILSLSRIKNLDIEEPLNGGGFVHIRDMPTKNIQDDESLKAVSNESENLNIRAGKRRRSPDAVDPGPTENGIVADFLSHPLMPRDAGRPSPSVRRRLNPIDAGNMASSSLNAPDPLFVSDPFSQFARLLQSTRTARDPSVLSNSIPTFPRVSDTSFSMPSLQPINLPAQSSFGQEYSMPARADNSIHALDSIVETATAPPSLISSDPFGYMDLGSLTPTVAQPTFAQPVFQTISDDRQGPTAGPSRHTFSSADVSTGSSNSDMQLPASTSTMATLVAPVHPYAFVTIGAGVKEKHIHVFTASHPLPATDLGGKECTAPYFVPLAAHPTGSSVMLLGGFGFLSRLHGLSIDALVEVEMVLADGTIITVNETDYPDLWWAIRGAGTAFGVVSRYKVKAYPVPVVFAGNLVYNFNPATAASLIKHFRDCIKGAPRELYANVLFTVGPADKDAIITIQLCYIGGREKGLEFLQAISSWDGEQCLLNEVTEKSYLLQQDSVAQILRGKAGRNWYIRSVLINSLPDDVIHQTVLKFANTPTGCTWLFELGGGAIADFKDTCLPLKNREALFTVAAFHQWELGVDDPRCVATAEEWITDILHPVSLQAPLPSFLQRREKTSRIIGAFGDNWERLREIKQKYDPNGLFKHSFWPLDNSGGEVDSHFKEPPSPTLSDIEMVTDDLDHWIH